MKPTIKYISLLIIIGLSLGLTVNIANASIFDWFSNLFQDEPIQTLGAPTQTFQTNLFPISNNAYVLGSSTRQWLSISVLNASSTTSSATTICLSGDACRTTWPTSTGGGFPAGTFNLNNLLGTTTFSGLLFAPTTSSLVGTSTLDVINGGTGATILTGYVFGNGASALTASTSIGLNYLTQSGASGSGWLSSTDWNTFNNKQATITDGAGLTFTGNTLDCDTASGSVFGCLSAANWTTFNNKQTASSTWSIPNGGTNNTAFNPYSIVVSDGTGSTLVASSSIGVSMIKGLDIYLTGTKVDSLNTQTGGPTFTGLLYGADTSSLIGTSTLSVANGGTGGTTFTNGLLIGNGNSLFTSTSTLQVSWGGSGASSLTGILLGNGASAFTATTSLGLNYIRQSGSTDSGWLSQTDWTTFNSKQATITAGTGLSFSGATLNASTTWSIPYGGTNNTAFTANNIIAFDGTKFVSTSSIGLSLIKGVGTMATQNANAVAITGGALDGVTLGLTTAGNATTTGLTVNGGTLLGSLSAANSTFSNATSTGGFSVTGGTQLNSLSFTVGTSTSFGTTGGAGFASISATQAGSVTAPSFSTGGSAGIYSISNNTLGIAGGGSGITWDGSNFYPNVSLVRSLGGPANIWAEGWFYNATSSHFFSFLNATGTTLSVTGQTNLGNATTTGLTVQGGSSLGSLSFGNATGTALTVTGGTSLGSLSLTNALTVSNGGLGTNTLTGLLQGNGTSAITAITGTAGQFPFFNGTNTLFATSTLFMSTNGNIGIGTTTPAAKLVVVGGCNGCSDINLPGGINLKNAKYVSATSSPSTAFVYDDVYTAPASRRAYVGNIAYYNPTAGSIIARSALKSGGNYYFLSASTTVTTLNPNNANVGFVLEPGETISVFQNISGMHAWLMIIEFDATVPFFSTSDFAPTNATTTLYTAPSGVSAMVTDQVAASLTGGRIILSNDTAGAVTHRYYVVKSGQVPEMGINNIESGTATVAARAVTSVGLLGGSAGYFVSLNSGDSIAYVLGTDLTGTHSIVWANIYEK